MPPPRLRPRPPACPGSGCGKAKVFSNALAARDAQTLLGVGSAGMILRSSDGGVSWRYQAPLPTADLHALSLSGLNAWAVGVGRRRSGLRRWRPFLARARHRRRRRSLRRPFHRRQSRLGRGRRRIDRHTGDGGGSWSAQASGVSGALRAIRMDSAGLRGVAVGDGGLLLTTANGGGLWTLRPGLVAAAIDLHAIALEGSNLWVVGDAATLLTSADGGATWNARTSDLASISTPSPSRRARIRSAGPWETMAASPAPSTAALPGALWPPCSTAIWPGITCAGWLWPAPAVFGPGQHAGQQ